MSRKSLKSVEIKGLNSRYNSRYFRVKESSNRTSCPNRLGFLHEAAKTSII